MPTETKKCIFCEKETNLRNFDLSGNLFCNLSCFQEYHKLRNSNNQTESHEHLQIEDILRIQKDENVFLANLPEDSEKQLKIITKRIEDMARVAEAMRQSTIILKKHVMKIRDTQESEKTERYRKQGVNSDLELKEKRLSKTQKMIASYKKMNLSLEQIINMMLELTVGKMTREEIMREYNSL
jgi:hypothetical protein